MIQKLIVEGNEGYIIDIILHKMQMSYPEGVNKQNFNQDFLKKGSGIDDALKIFSASLATPDITNIGIILDADDKDVKSRWQAISSRVLKYFPDINLSSYQFSNQGIIVKEDGFPTIGLWVMPNNQDTGYFEHFLASMIAEDNLWIEANQKVDEIYLKYDHLNNIRKQKAKIYTWLAWQKNPGASFGRAMQGSNFDINTQEVQDFTNWLIGTFSFYKNS